MQYVSTDELKRRIPSLIERIREEPVTIRDAQQDVAVLVSADEYRRLTRDKVEELKRFCDTVGRRAAARGLTDDKLAELLAGDD